MMKKISLSWLKFALRNFLLLMTILYYRNSSQPKATQVIFEHEKLEFETRAGTLKQNLR